MEVPLLRESKNYERRVQRTQLYTFYFYPNFSSASLYIVAFISLIKSRGASQMCKNKERKIIRDESSRITRETQSCGSSSSCSEPELISSRQSSKVSIIFCISSQTERLKTDITVSICSVVPALPKCLYLLSFEDVA